MSFSTQFKFKKTWNRLHRLQRTIIIVILILLFLYILTHIEFHRSGLKQIDTKHKHEPNNRVPPKQVSREFKGCFRYMYILNMDSFYLRTRRLKKTSW